MADDRPIYASNSRMRPDSEFVPGDLDRLVVGNRGRLLDARRTPVTVMGVEPARGAFVVRVDAFEDAGASWELFLGELSRFQFERDAAHAAADQVKELEESHARFDRELVIECDSSTRAKSHRELQRRRGLVRRQFDARLSIDRLEIQVAIERRHGDPGLWEVTDELLDQNGLRTIETQFLGPLISNPRSGEMVKGHAIVLAELGLCSYRGRVIRDPDLFTGDRSKQARSEHLLWRMALTQEIWAAAGPVPLYRGAASDDGSLDLARPASLVSATFSKAVADSHYAGGPSTKAAMLIREQLPLDRLVLSFLETEAMNGCFKEAEALLIGTGSSSGHARPGVEP